jgi:hypothetical protein
MSEAEIQAMQEVYHEECMQALVYRKLLRQALAALVYHTEQTRPIHETNEAIKAIRQELNDE